MTELDPRDDHRAQDPDTATERTSRLLDLARTADPTADALAALSAVERAELADIRGLLDLIDASWHSAPAERERVQALFLQQLAADDPDHPWVRRATVPVRTLGELVRAGGDEMPPLPADAYNQLVADETPVDALLDPAGRTAVVGEAVRRAAVPPSAIGELLLWLNRSLGKLLPRGSSASSGPAAGFLFAREQGRPARRREPPANGARPGGA
jgi:hypothetical protein